jgi:hypothetical protein
LKARITVKFIVAAAQSLIALLALFLAIFLHFNLADIQTFLGVPDLAVNFYAVMLIVFGFVFLISGLFLVFDWWEAQ